MTSTDDLLKSLDPAAPAADPNGPRARADMQRILATAASTNAPLPGVNAADAFRTLRRRRTGTRIALATGLVAAATATALALPSLVGGDQAFATWTATPSGMSAAETAKVAESCRKRMKSTAPEFRNKLEAAKPVVAERRGKWALVILADQNRFSAQCLGDRSTGRRGSAGDTPVYNLPGPRKLTTGHLGTANLDGGEVSLVTGLAGSEVKAISYTSAVHGKVVATVSGGHFALWFPGDELGKRLETGTRGFPLQVGYRDGTKSTVQISL